MERVILLNNDYNFLGIIDWKRAVTLIVTGKVEVLKTTDKLIRNAERTVEIMLPKVVRLINLARKIYKAKVPYSKKNVIVRDQYVCQYCGDQVLNRMTIDHVIPSSRGGKTSFENCVACCRSCNSKKANRLPHECGMFPSKTPYRPTIMEFVTLKMKSLGVDKTLKELWE